MELIKITLKDYYSFNSYDNTRMNLNKHFSTVILVPLR